MNFKALKKTGFSGVLLGISFLFLFSLFLSGCTDFLNGKSKKNDVLKIQIVDAACAVDFKDKVSQMLRSEASEQDIHLVFDCMDQYLNQFQNKVEGRNTPDLYDVDDLLYITNRFFKDLNLSEEALQHILKLKKGLVGGESQVVSKSELVQVRELLKKLKAEVLVLHPYFRFLSFEVPDEAKTVSENDIRKAVEQLRVSATNILNSTRLASSDYTYQEAKDLLLSLNILKPEHADLLSDLDFIRQLILGRESLSTLADYTVVLNNHLDFYQLFLLAIHGHIVFEMQSLETTQKTVGFVDEIVNTLKNTFQYYKTARISLNDLDGVIKVILQKKILPFKVKFKTFQDFYKIALKRVFRMRSDEFIDSVQFNVYAREAELFRLELKFLESLSSKAYKAEEIQKKFSQFIEQKSYSLLPGPLSSDDKKALITDLINLNYDFYTEYPLLVKNRKYLVSVFNAQTVVSPLDLLHSFYIRMLARQLLMGWGDGQKVSQLIQSQLTRDQLIQFMTDFNDFGIELKLNDPRSKNNGSKNFLEADILLFHSDGNGMMSMLETFEYLHHLVAEGAWVVNQIQADLKAQQCNIEEQDVFGVPYSDDNCFYLLMKHNYSKYFVNKPGLVQYLSRLSEYEFKQYYTLLMDVARFDMKNKGIKVETVDLQSFVVITDYVEGLLTKYDTDKNGSLSANEIRAGYPKFKTFATEYSLNNAADSLAQWDSTFNYCRFIYSKEDLIRESFVYMVLNNGITPTVGDLNLVTCAVNGLFTFKNQVDRKTIINTFFVLKTVLASEE